MLQKLPVSAPRDAMLLDGDARVAMAMGDHANRFAAGSLHGGWRPVATYSASERLS